MGGNSGQLKNLVSNNFFLKISALQKPLFTGREISHPALTDKFARFFYSISEMYSSIPYTGWSKSHPTVFHCE